MTAGGSDPNAVINGLEIAAAPVYTTQYDRLGSAVAETDPLGNATLYEYDVMGRWTKRIQVDPDGSGSAVQQYVSARRNHPWRPVYAAGECSNSLERRLAWRIERMVQPSGCGGNGCGGIG